MKTILLTGGTGFLGSHLIHDLIQNNYKIIFLKRSTSNLYRIRDVLDEIKYYDVDNIETAFKEQQINIIIHTACCYGRLNDKLSQVIDTNILFGVRLLEFAILNKTELFINTDTFFNTNSLKNKLNTYSLSKRQFFEWLKQSSDKIQVINMKLEHMYGNKDDISKFVPWIIDQLNKNTENIDLTEGFQKRDFIYIDDVVSAYLKVLEQHSFLHKLVEFDVGTGNVITLREFINELVKQYKEIYKKNKTTLSWGALEYREGEMMDINVDISGLESIGWKSKYLYKNGISEYLSSLQDK